MADVDPATLPTVAQAKELQRDDPNKRGKEKEKTKAPIVRKPIVLKSQRLSSGTG